MSNLYVIRFFKKNKGPKLNIKDFIRQCSRIFIAKNKLKTNCPQNMKIENIRPQIHAELSWQSFFKHTPRGVLLTQLTSKNLVKEIKVSVSYGSKVIKIAKTIPCMVSLFKVESLNDRIFQCFEKQYYSSYHPVIS